MSKILKITVALKSTINEWRRLTILTCAITAEAYKFYDYNKLYITQITNLKSH